jgi:hypothetical protein
MNFKKNCGENAQTKKKAPKKKKKKFSKFFFFPLASSLANNVMTFCDMNERERGNC